MAAAAAPTTPPPLRRPWRPWTVRAGRRRRRRRRRRQRRRRRRRRRWRAAAGGGGGGGRGGRGRGRGRGRGEGGEEESRELSALFLERGEGMVAAGLREREEGGGSLKGGRAPPLPPLVVVLHTLFSRARPNTHAQLALRIRQTHPGTLPQSTLAQTARSLGRPHALQHKNRGVRSRFPSRATPTANAGPRPSHRPPGPAGHDARASLAPASRPRAGRPARPAGRHRGEGERDGSAITGARRRGRRRGRAPAPSLSAQPRPPSHNPLTTTPRTSSPLSPPRRPPPPRPSPAHPPWSRATTRNTRRRPPPPASPASSSSAPAGAPARS